MSPEERAANQQELGVALFLLAKAAAEYAALPIMAYHTGPVNPAYRGELLQTMQDSARIIAALLLKEENS